jgi:hypothetical protein
MQPITGTGRCYYILVQSYFLCDKYVKFIKSISEQADEFFSITLCHIDSFLKISSSAENTRGFASQNDDSAVVVVSGLLNSFLKLSKKLLYKIFHRRTSLMRTLERAFLVSGLLISKRLTPERVS